MNINALLSPDESPPAESSSSSSRASNSPQQARNAAGGVKRSTSNLSQELTRSPESNASNASSRPTTAKESPPRPAQAFPLPPISRAAAPNFRPLHQPAPTSHPSPALESSTRQGQSEYSSYSRPDVAHRPSSTPQMETLADLASMRQQTPRTHSANNIRHTELAKSLSPSLVNPSAAARPPIFHNNSGRSIAELAMAESASETPPPRVVESSAMSESDSKTVTELLNYLKENSYAYESHVALINLLHTGFIANASQPADSSGQERRDPKSYSLLTELRQAREAMETRFAVGEDIWDDWLSDEILLATSSEERIAVTELFQKAVQDEPSSVKLWQMYAGWVWINYAACNAREGADQSKWTEEDRNLCIGLFTRDMVIQVLEQAIAATQWRVDESHLLWNRYAELVQEDFPASPTQAEIDRLRNMYMNRMQFPHAKWEETNQMFWSIVSKYEGSKWESLMAEVQGLTVPAKTQMGLREPHEQSLRRALNGGDKGEIFNQFNQYLHWERKHEKKQKQRSAYDSELRCALYERALLRFPTYTEWWLDYIDYFLTGSGSPKSALPLIERATGHCPWSGDLWARRILQSDVERKPHDEIEATKHRATNSGLLDVGGMEEMVKVLQQWCSYLRRHAFSAGSSEDDVDIAEVGITLAIEDIQEAGKKIYGKDFNGDPLFRLEIIQIKFFAEARRFEDARAIYRSLSKTQGNCYDFWARYYNWELWIWGYDRMKDPHRVETQDNGPDKATAVVKEALSQRDLDWPEKVLTMYLNHFQLHDSGERLRTAMVEAREFSKHLAIRRAKEAAEAAELQPQSAELPMAPQVSDVKAAATGEKRKRGEEILSNGYGEKKSRTEIVPASEVGYEQPSASATAPIKRDREHNTIVMKKLAPDVQELEIKKFFRDIGAPISINILQDAPGETATATVEFDSHEDVLAAKTRDGKTLNGREVHIRSSTQTTLYVANYPPEYDETAIRKLFDRHGEIVSVRFPSLKFNNRRRFCYVQFLTAEMAKGAEHAMDDKILPGGHKLLARISDPDAKKQRSGAQAEGRELFVKNIERTLSDEEIKEFFEKYGTVVSMNIVKLVSGKKIGTAFIVYSSEDEATKALEANNTPFHDRILQVELASAKGRAAPLDRARKEDIIINQNRSTSGDPEELNGRRGSDVSMASSAPAGDESWKTAKERKIAIFNLPDTVNDARVRAAMEEYGPLVKIQMRRGDHGAIVEFANVQDAFNVRHGVDCSALGSDVKTGDVADLLAKVKKRQNSQALASSSDVGMMKPPALARPTQRGGRRGGLGFKRGGGFGAGRTTGGDGATSEKGGAAKSNADFRAMFVKGKESEAPQEKEAS